jgi:hypothetical protein
MLLYSLNDIRHLNQFLKKCLSVNSLYIECDIPFAVIECTLKEAFLRVWDIVEERTDISSRIFSVPLNL